MFIIGKVTLPRNSRGLSMVGRHAKNRGKCLVDDYVLSLLEEVHLDLAQNKLMELASLWELVSGPNKRRFYDLYG